jgi:outer membrane protein OmpA-like peptidoglycan-associated protein
MFAQDTTEVAKEKQTRAEKRKDFSHYFYVGLNAGANLNHTDISNELFAPEVKSWRMGYGGYFGWQFSPIWGARLQVTNGKLDGFRTNEDRLLFETTNLKYEDIEFNADIFDYQIDLTIDLNSLFAGYKDRKFTVFANTGWGSTEWATTSWDLASGTEWRNNGNGDDTPDVEGMGTAGGIIGDRTKTWFIPVGLGLNYHFAEHWHAALETQLKMVDSDRLDTWTKGEMVVYSDMYSYTSLGIYYRFGGSDPLKKMAKEWESATFKAEPDPLEAHGDKVPVKITGTFPEKYFSPKAAMLVNPVLKCEDGTTFELDPILLKGEDVAGEGIIIPEDGGSFTYYDTVDYHTCQRASELIISPTAFIPKEELTEDITLQDVEANYKYVKLNDRKLADGVIITPTRLHPKSTGIVAAHGYVLESIISKKAFIYFEVNKHNLNWNLSLNKLEANKKQLTDVINFVNSGYKIQGINIDGWASPEGEETFNQGLSENRAKTAQSYLIEKLNKIIKSKDNKMTIKDAKTDIQYDLAHHGADWNGFLSNVQNSNIKDKNIILNVINSAGTPAKKEQEIRNMIVIYPELEEKMLPPLRRAEIVVNEYEPKRPAEEILSLAISNPGLLSEHELLYAATLTKDKDAQLQIYKSAINNYPNSYKGYLGASAIEIEKGDYTAAKAHLDKAASLEPNSGEVYYNLGVVYAMQSNDAKAMENFTKAQNLGQDATYNVGVQMIKKGDYAKAISYFGNTTCDYNVAVAHIASKNYTAAEKQLNCAPKDAGTYYLSAILGARTANTSMLFDNLTKAVQADASLKDEAKMDREFIKYFEDPNFTAIVK